MDGIDDDFTKRMRAYALWAAFHFSSSDESGNPRATLISVTQDIGSYAQDFLDLLGDFSGELAKALGL
jgi:hypothetical protein